MVTLKLDERTSVILDFLKGQLRENTNEGVVRKAIALLAQVVEVSGKDRYFIVKTSTGREYKINLDEQS